MFERVVKNGIRDARGVGRVVLDVNRQRRAALCQLTNQRFDQQAGRAFALGDDDEAVGQGMHGACPPAQPNDRACASAPRRAVMAKNSATVSSMICCADFTESIRPTVWPARAGAASMLPSK